MRTRQLGTDGPVVSPLGLGCMGMSWAYDGQADRDEMIRLMHRAVDRGVTLFDTAEMYGPYTNEELVGDAIGARTDVVVATKFGFRIDPAANRPIGVDSRPEHIRSVVDASLTRLRRDRIDLLYQHRVDPAVPIEDVAGTVGDLVTAGKVGHFGLSEVSANTVRRAHAVHPVAAVQTEYSLWCRPAAEALFGTLEELGVGFVAYSPLGRGFLTGTITADTEFGQSDTRTKQSRFSADHRAENLAFVDALTRVADAAGCTIGQLALAWILAQRSWNIAIPGTRRLSRLEENLGAASLELSAAQLAEIDEICAAHPVEGERYSPADLARLDGSVS